MGPLVFLSEVPFRIWSIRESLTCKGSMMGTRLPIMRLTLADLLVVLLPCNVCCCCANLAFSVSRKPDDVLVFLLSCWSIECFRTDFGLLLLVLLPLVALLPVLLINFALRTAMKLCPTPPGPWPWIFTPVLTAVTCAAFELRSWEAERIAAQDRSTEDRVTCNTVLCGIVAEELCDCAWPVAFRRREGLAGVCRSSVSVLTVSDTEMDRWGVGLAVGEEPSNRNAGGGGRFSVSSQAVSARSSLGPDEGVLNVAVIMVDVRLVGGGGLFACCIDPLRTVKVDAAPGTFQAFSLWLWSECECGNVVWLPYPLLDSTLDSDVWLPPSFSVTSVFSVPGTESDAGGGGNGNCISWARLAARFANSCILTYIGCWSWWVANSLAKCAGNGNFGFPRGLPGGSFFTGTDGRSRLEHLFGIGGRLLPLFLRNCTLDACWFEEEHEEEEETGEAGWLWQQPLLSGAWNV